MKKRILIASYYFPPNIGTGSPRPYSWAKHFAKEGHEVVVVTRHWDGNDNTWDDYTGSTSSNEIKSVKMDGFETVYLPFRKFEYNKNSIVRKLETLSSLFNGELEREVNTMQFYPYINQRLSKEKFDLVITSAPPWNMVKLGYTIKKECGVPAVIDFRDYELDMVLNQKPTPTLGRKIEFLIDRFFITRWLKDTEFILSASKPMGDYLTKRTGINNIEVLNGYDAALLEKLRTQNVSEKFTISVLGYIYPPQQLDILFKGFEIFTKKYPNPDLIFRFIGLEAIPKVAEKIKAGMPAHLIETTKRLPMEDSLQIGHQTHVLFYPGWKDWIGMYSAKIATYIGLCKNILIAPGDGDVLNNIMQETNAGVVADSPQEFADNLSGWYEEWKNTGKLVFHGKKEKAYFYSREYQAEYFLNQIEERIFSKN